MRGGPRSARVDVRTRAVRGDPAPRARGPVPVLERGGSMALEAIRYSRGSLQILDQLLLPQRSCYEAVGSVRQAWEDIRAMKVGGQAGAGGAWAGGPAGFGGAGP